MFSQIICPPPQRSLADEVLRLYKSVTHGALPEAHSPLVKQLIIDYAPQIHIGLHPKTHNRTR